MHTLHSKCESQIRELKILKGKLRALEEDLSRTHIDLESEARKRYDVDLLNHFNIYYYSSSTYININIPIGTIIVI